MMRYLEAFELAEKRAALTPKNCRVQRNTVDGKMRDCVGCESFYRENGGIPYGWIPKCDRVEAEYQKVCREYGL